MRLMIAQINPIVGDLVGNSDLILNSIQKGKEQGAEIVLFPELALCGYPPDDFLWHPEFIEKCEKTLQDLLPSTLNISCVIGMPRKEGADIYNSAAVLSNGKLIGFQDKMLLPTYDVFDESRYFKAAEASKLFEIGGKRVAITICEDIWQHSGALKITYARDPIKEIIDLEPDLVLNLSASPYHFDKAKERLNVASLAAKSLNTPFALCNQVGGNDSLIFDGYSLVMNKKGELVERLKGFQSDLSVVDLDLFFPQNYPHIDPVEDLHHALVLGLKDYFVKSGFEKACLGLSGGVDSALVASLAVSALGKENVYAIAMPSRYSSDASYNDAHHLASNLGIELDEISIESPYQAYLTLLTPHFDNLPADVTEENLQSRIRGMILMALSNKKGYIVLSTGNKSEMAMGYSTLYGDLAGGLAVLSDVSKDKVYKLCHYINKDKEIIPHSILEKAPSAELRPNQKDSDSLPPYPIIDLVLEEYVEKMHSAEEIAALHKLDLKLVNDLIQKIHRSEYKRRQAPPGLRVTEKAFTIGRRFPIVQKFI